MTKRFPNLNFGLLEGGVAWAVTLLNDIVEHFEKRNVTDLLEHLDCGMTGIRDLRTLFCENFYFGCEADDRMMAVGFNRKLSPIGAPLKAVFGSDIGHWNVMDARSILSEAYGLVGAGLLTQDDFKAFTWTNPVSLHVRMNPDYFAGTVIEVQAESVKALLPKRTPVAL